MLEASWYERARRENSKRVCDLQNFFHPKLFDAILTCCRTTSYVPFTTTTTCLSRRALKIAAINYSSTLIAPCLRFFHHILSKLPEVPWLSLWKVAASQKRRKKSGFKVKTTSSMKLFSKSIWPTLLDKLIAISVEGLCLFQVSNFLCY